MHGNNFQLVKLSVVAQLPAAIKRARHLSSILQIFPKQQ